MKIPSEIALEPGVVYCSECLKPTVDLRTTEAGKEYVCRSCGAASKRRVELEPSMRWWIAEDRELWHESVGVLAFNPEGKLLIFELTKFPFGATVPAGHRDADEPAEAAALRELREETGLEPKKTEFLGEVDIPGDSCGRGADIHRWSVFISFVDSPEVVLDSSEGMNGRWFSPDEAAEQELTLPVRRIFEIFGPQIAEAAQRASALR